MKKKNRPQIMIGMDYKKNKGILITLVNYFLHGESRFFEGDDPSYKLEYILFP